MCQARFELSPSVGASTTGRTERKSKGMRANLLPACDHRLYQRGYNVPTLPARL